MYITRGVLSVHSQLTGMNVNSAILIITPHINDVQQPSQQQQTTGYCAKVMCEQTEFLFSHADNVAIGGPAFWDSHFRPTFYR